MELRAPTAEDETAILALNQRHVAETSPLSAASWRDLTSTGFRARAAVDGGALLGFVLALHEDSVCDGPNFGWFRRRYPAFVYVDRVIVDAAHRQRGVARALYNDLIDAARAAGKPLVCCEVNFDPPNPASDLFHASMGFAEVGRAFLDGSGKTVRYLTRRVD